MEIQMENTISLPVLLSRLDVMDIRLKENLSYLQEMEISETFPYTMEDSKHTKELTC